MNIEKLRQMAWIGDGYLTGKISGVVLSFHGLGYSWDKSAPDLMELELAHKGWLVVFPYYGPWSWMNRNARKFTDEVVGSVYDIFHLNDEIPLISTGGSMGGFSSLLYTRYAKMKVSGCLALFPVCDLKYHFGERPDLPKTIHYAFRGYAEDMEELFIEHSPLHQVGNMPDIPYLIIHGGKDSLVNKENHSDKLVTKMRETNMNVEYIEIPYMEHGSLIPMEVYSRMVGFVDSFRTSSK